MVVSWSVGGALGIGGGEEGRVSEKPAAGGKIGFLRPLRASWGAVSLEIGFAVAGSVGFRGQTVQFEAGCIVEGVRKNWCGSGGGVAIVAAPGHRNTKIEKNGPARLFFWTPDYFFLEIAAPQGPRPSKSPRNFVQVEGGQKKRFTKKIISGGASTLLVFLGGDYFFL